MRGSSLRPSSACWALALILAAASARAEGPLVELDKERARTRYAQGAQAFEAGKYKEAIELFQDAGRFFPNPVLSYNIGLAYEGLGETSRALRAYRDCLRHLPPADDRAELERAVARLEKALQTRGVQQLAVLSTPPGASVLLDKRFVGVTPWAGELAPGEHQVVLQLPAHEEVATALVLPADRAVDVFLTLKPLALGPKPTPRPVNTAPLQRPVATPRLRPAPPTTLEQVRPWTWASLGIGATGLGTALLFEIRRSNSETALAAATTQSAVDRNSAAADSEAFATRVSAGIGLVGVAIGGISLVLDLRRQAPINTATFGVGCGRTTCLLSGAGRF